MRSLLFTFILLSFLQTNAQQSEINGVISIQNSETETGKRVYVSNALVQDKFGKAQPYLTNNSGVFRLVYFGVPEKSSVHFDVTKPNTDLEIVNFTALDAVTGQREIINISMASKKKIADYRIAIYKVGKTNAQKNLEVLLESKSKELNLLKNEYSKNVETINRLEEEISSLERKVDEQAQDLADRYSRINLDDAPPIFRDAFLLFQQGNLDSALKVLNKIDIPTSVNNILQRKENTAFKKRQIAIEDSLNEQDTKNLLPVIKFKIDLYTTVSSFDSALHYYEWLIKLNTSNGDNNFQYARLLDFVNQNNKAIKYYSKALKLYRDNSGSDSQTYKPKVADVLKRLGGLYLETHNNSAKSTLLEAVKIDSQLLHFDSNVYKIEIANTENILGLLYKDQNDTVNAKKSFLKSLALFKNTKKSDTDYYKPEIALVLNNLGIFYKNTNDTINSDFSYSEALELRRYLVKKDSSILNRLLLQSTLVNLGNLHKNDSSRAAKYYDEAIKTIRSFPAQISQIYEPDLALVLVDYGNLYAKSDSAKALKSFREALEIRKRLAKDNPETYDPLVANVLNSIGAVYYWNNDFKNSESPYIESLNIYKRLVENNFNDFEQNAGELANSLGNVYLKESNYNDAGICYTEALEVRKHLAKDKPKVFEFLVEQTLNNLIELYYKNQNHLLLENYLSEAIKLEFKISKEYPNGNHDVIIAKAETLLQSYNERIMDSLHQDIIRGDVPNSFKLIESELRELSMANKDVKTHLLYTYHGLSLLLLYSSNFPESEHLANRGLTLDNSFIANEIVYAHALLFQNKYEKAFNEYKKIKNKTDQNGNSYADFCISDFNSLEMHGVTNMYVDKIRVFLMK